MSMNDLANARRKYLDKYVGFDYILDEYHDRDYSEFITSMGGDVSRNRVYGSSMADFRVYEK